MDYTIIRKNIDPAIDKFIESLKSIEAQLHNKEMDLSIKLEGVKNRETELRAIEDRLKKEHSDKLDDISRKISEFDKSVLDCDKEKSRYTNLIKDIETKERTVSDIKSAIKKKKKATGEALEEAKEKSNKLAVKLQALEMDFAKLDAQRKEVAERDNLLRQRAVLLDKREEELESKEKELEDIKYDVKMHQKKVHKELKRLNLENNA